MICVLVTAIALTTLQDRPQTILAHRMRICDPIIVRQIRKGRFVILANGRAVTVNRRKVSQ